MDDLVFEDVVPVFSDFELVDAAVAGLAVLDLTELLLDFEEALLDFVADDDFVPDLDVVDLIDVDLEVLALPDVVADEVVEAPVWARAKLATITVAAAKPARDTVVRRK